MPSKSDILSDFIMRVTASDPHHEVPEAVIAAAEVIGTRQDELHVLRELAIQLRGVAVRAGSAAVMGKPVEISVSQGDGRVLMALVDLARALALDDSGRIAKAMDSAWKELYGA